MPMHGSVIYIAEKAGTFLEVGKDVPLADLKTLVDNDGLLFWDNEGQWAFANQTTLRNVYALLHDYNRKNVFPRMTAPPAVTKLNWSQMRKIPKLIADGWITKLSKPAKAVPPQSSR